jgi:hypothetical protein
VLVGARVGDTDVGASVGDAGVGDADGRDEPVLDGSDSRRLLRRCQRRRAGTRLDRGRRARRRARLVGRRRARLVGRCRARRARSRTWLVRRRRARLGHLGIIGECNIHPVRGGPNQNRTTTASSRSTRASRGALASKATGYPLAFVAAKLSLGIQLPDIVNQVTNKTTACLEPSLDYVVTKIPRWDLAKLDKASRKIGSSIKSIGEVMAIGRNATKKSRCRLKTHDQRQGPRLRAAREPVQGAFRSAELVEELTRPSDVRLYAIAHALVSAGPWTASTS